MKIIPAADLKQGDKFYYPVTVGPPQIFAAMQDAFQLPPDHPHFPGAWKTTYDGAGFGQPWPAIFERSTVAVPEPGDGPAPITWHDRHMDGW